MFTEFKSEVKEILSEVLRRGIFAIETGAIGEPCDLGILAKSLIHALEIRVPDSGPYLEHFKTQFDGGYVGEYVSPELVEFLVHGTMPETIRNDTGFDINSIGETIESETDGSGNADADADADADVGTDLDEARVQRSKDIGFIQEATMHLVKVQAESNPLKELNRPFAESIG